jgi:hypothetical protein
MASLSDVLSDPWETAATYVASATVDELKGWANRPAFTLAELAGRNSELLLFSTVDSPGRDNVSTTVTAIHTTMISQRNRTANRPRAANKRWSSKKSYLCGLRGSGAPAPVR